MKDRRNDQKSIVRPIRPDRSVLGARPTQQTIADLTGLAVTTVSKALRQDTRISQKTRELVERVAREIGYVPDRAALRLRTGKTHIISLILDPHNEILGFGNSMVSGIVEALQGTAYHLNITPHFTDGDGMEPVVEIVRNGLADGLIFSRTRALDARVRFLNEARFPFVTHGRTEFVEPHCYVDYDNEAFAYEAAKHLVSKGCSRLSILLPLAEFTFYQHMRYGFMRAVRETGVDYHAAGGRVPRLGARGSGAVGERTGAQRGDARRHHLSGRNIVFFSAKRLSVCGQAAGAGLLRGCQVRIARIATHEPAR